MKKTRETITPIVATKKLRASKYPIEMSQGQYKKIIQKQEKVVLLV